MVKEEQQQEKGVDQAAQLALVLLRYFMGWDQGDLAQKARIAPSQVSVYDRGDRTVPPQVLSRAADAAELPGYLLEPVLRAIRSFLAAARGRSRAERVLSDSLFAGLIDLGRLAAETVLAVEAEQSVARPPSAEDREEAAELWARMKRRTSKQRRALVEETEEYRSWALCERVAAASLEAAGSSPAHRKELAELALYIAELAPGEEAWRSRLQGYAWAHVGNACLACGDPSAAEHALARARRLWQAGAAGDPGLLDIELLP